MKYRFCVFIFFVFSSVIGSVAKSSEDVARGAGLVPHKALYKIALVSTKSASQIANVDGAMFYEWRSKCDAWTSDHRFNLSYEYTDAPAMRITSDFSTYETFDGTAMNFTSRRRRDGNLYEELRGRATINPAQSGRAVYTKPPNLSFDLPAGSFFPMGHTMDVMKAVKAGKTFHNAVIFDGSDSEGPVRVNSFIGKRADVTDLLQNMSKDVERELLQSPAHNLRLAFFPLNQEGPGSDYEMSITLHENGIISDMFVEYDDFSITQKLIALEALEGTCESIKDAQVGKH